MTVERTSPPELPAALAQLAEGPVFVLGHARSGTTWVYEMLTAQEQVAGVFESWLFSGPSGLGLLFGAHHWGDVERIGTQDGMVGHRSRLPQLLTREELTHDVRELASGWLGRALEPQHRFLVEKGPSMVTVAAEVFPEARFIHVLRDGRDVSISAAAAERSWAPEFKQHARGRPWPWRYGRTWRQHVRMSREAAGGLGDRFMEIRYEDVRADPLVACRTLYDFCRIPYDEALLRLIVQRTSFDQYEAQADRRFRREGKTGAWRRRFGVWACLLFNLAAGDALVEAGYERSRWWWSGRIVGDRVR